MKRGILSLKRKKNPQERKEEKTNLIESLTSMIWFRAKSVFKKCTIGKYSLTCSEWPTDASAVSPIEKKSIALRKLFTMICIFSDSLVRSLQNNPVCKSINFYLVICIGRINSYLMASYEKHLFKNTLETSI